MKINKIKYNKIWLTKDKYIYRASLGYHWYLKKFIVYYKYFLVKRVDISNETLKEISQIFTEFIDSINNDKIKEDAIQFFFNPVDIRKPKTVLDFKSFNDLDEYDDAARKYFIVYLMKIGMQAGIKKAIGRLLYSDNDITISKILKTIPEIQKEEIEKKIKEGKTPRSVNDSRETIFSDFHAEIRNYRQLLSYYGIIPPEEDGYTMNEVSNLICESNQRLIMSIWEHQKLKLRFNNPYTRVLTTQNPEEKYKTINDFNDFAVNPFIAIIQVLYYLLTHDEKQAYIDFYDYKFIICREAPFNIGTVTNKILKFRNLSESEKEVIIDAFDNRPKKRKFSINQKKSSSADFLKEMSNLLYGISSYKYIKDTNQDISQIVEYSNQRIIITDKEKFENYAQSIIITEQYLQHKYKNTYKKIQNYASLKLVDEIYKHKDISNPYKNTIQEIRKYFLNDYGDQLNDFYENVLNEWKSYVSTIDHKLLLLCHANRITLDYGKYTHINKLPISDQLSNITGVDLQNLQIVTNNIIRLFNNNSCEELLNTLENINYKQYDLHYDEIETQLSKQLQNNDYSIIKAKLKKERNDTLYGIQSGKRQKVRNTKLMYLIKKERLEKNIIQNEYRPSYEVNKCDICENSFQKGEPECHHIIPFEIGGPDSEYNYTFLCKKCHKVFTHKTKNKEVRFNIERLKMKRIFNISNIERMTDEGLINKHHIDYLLKGGYISIVQNLELKKRIHSLLIKDYDLEKFLKKTTPSRNRWNRAMKLVYFYRKKHNLIMEDIRKKYNTENCDTCNKEFGRNEPECHHIIPKVINGPESSYNYAYLCIECHKSFTHNWKNKKELINKLISNSLITENTITQMILENCITKEHLDYLYNDEYIKINIHNKLSRLLNKINSN